MEESLINRCFQNRRPDAEIPKFKCGGHHADGVIQGQCELPTALRCPYAVRQSEPQRHRIIVPIRRIFFQIIGRIYPIFGGILLLSAIGIFIMIFVKG